MNIESIPNSENRTTQTEWDSLRDPIELLRDTAIDMTSCKESVLATDFPSGVFLYHGARIEQIEEIFSSGAIMNAGAIYEKKLDEKRAELEAAGKSEEEIELELKKVWIPRNSGQEGVSWSANGIDAMPGTMGHIAGFLAAPERVLADDKLVVPSRPAPYELLQISGGVDAEKLYETKKQHEVWGYRDLSIGEMASVDSGLMFLLMADSFDSLLIDFANHGGLPAEELRKHYEVMEDGKIRINPELHQQGYDENYLPPAAVWMQYMIDAGMFKETEAEGLSLNDLIKKVAEDNRAKKTALFYKILGHARQQEKIYDDEYESELEKADRVAIPVEEMYFVASHHDLAHWLEVIRKTGHCPRGILLYDDEKVVKENFAQKEQGDNVELSAEIGRAVGADKSFWPEIMAIDVENVPRAGTKGQVLAESAVNHNKEIRMANGKLIISSS
ncbi:hypothetical protein IKG10_02915 [Candidatus Saccharibacteria bacterium]|nr:hypothetical protein [Candidatus Saccharibacteria bacterium]